jgi:hypothetical protein
MNAREIESFERCTQRFSYEREWEPFEISPTELLRTSVVSGLASGESCKDSVLKLASQRNLTANLADPYASVQHHAAIAEVIERHVQLTLGPIKPVPSEGWSTDALLDGKGNLHRFLFVDRWDEDRMREESHSWRTLGDLIYLKHPLYWNVYVLGASKEGRRYGNWSRGFLHPQSRQLRFCLKSGGEGKWEPVWRERTQYSPDDWMKVMSKDGILEKSMLRIRVPISRNDRRVLEAKEDLVRIQVSMASLVPQKSRSACDWPVCPFQAACWNGRGIEAEGIYRRVRYLEEGERQSVNTRHILPH